MSEDSLVAFPANVTLSRFFDRIYQDQSGWVYVPKLERLEDGGKGRWTKKFFKWPQEKERMIDYIMINTPDHDVYYSPALWKEDCTTQPLSLDKFKGTYFVWAEFDGRLPDDDQMSGLPQPSIRMRSSEAKHEHWYWELTFLETSTESLENLTKRLAYALGADLSGWDFSQVLRPPGTIHQESGKTTTILHDVSSRVTIERFADLPAVSDAVDVQVENFGELPAFNRVLLKYALPEKELDLFMRTKEHFKVAPGRYKQRSDALTRAAFVCLEAGMKNEEILAILKKLDDSWEKYKGRGEAAQLKYLVGIVRYVRSKKPGVDADDLFSELRVRSGRELRSLEIHVDWLVKGLLTTKSIVFLTGKSDVGKTKFTYALAAHMALGKPYMGLEFSRPMRLLVVQMESPEEETKEAQEQVLAEFTPEEQEMLLDNLFWLSPGFGLNLHHSNLRQWFLDRFDEIKPDGIIWDSFQTAVGGDILDHKSLTDVFNWIKKQIAFSRNIFSIFLHHNRKEQIGNKKPKTIDDLLGGQTIVSVATTIFGLWRDRDTDSIVEFYKIKTRYAKTIEALRFHHVEAYRFEVVKPASLGLAVDSPGSGSIMSYEEPEDGEFDGMDV